MWMETFSQVFPLSVASWLHVRCCARCRISLLLNLSSPTHHHVTVGVHTSVQRASITFLFDRGCSVNLSFGISSVTNIVALEVLRGDFLDAQNLSSCFVFHGRVTCTGERGRKNQSLCETPWFHTTCESGKEATKELPGRGRQDIYRQCCPWHNVYEREHLDIDTTVHHVYCTPSPGLQWIPILLSYYCSLLKEKYLFCTSFWCRML